MSWMDNLVPASFRGVPFNVDSHDSDGGRRTVEHEFPNRDTPYAEDMGRRARTFSIRGYVIADLITNDYFPGRDALTHACDNVPGAGLLNHPWLGAGLSVLCKTCRLREDISSGGMAAFDLVFVESGVAASPITVPDTASGVLGGLAQMRSALAQGLAIAGQVLSYPATLVGEAAAVLGISAGAIIGIAGGIIGTVADTLSPLDPAVTVIRQQVTTTILLAGALPGVVNGLSQAGAAPVTGAITGVVGDPVAVAVVEVTAALANAVLAAGQGLQDLGSVAGQVVTAQRMQADPTLGVSGLAGFGAGLPMPVGFGAALSAELQAQLVTLVTASATLAVAEIYANTDFSSSNAAAAARTAVLGMIQAQILQSAAAANDPLYQGWMALAGLVSADLIARIQSLPSLTRYRFATSLPACVIAQRLYGDGTRALEVALLNDAVHPGFMAASGICLSA